MAQAHLVKGEIFFNESLKEREYNYLDVLEGSSKIDFSILKNLGTIAINKELYLRCEKNIIRLLVLLSLISFKDEGKENYTKEEVINRILFIKKYYNIIKPEIINNIFYFKPDMLKVEKLLYEQK
ncbi:hypothetical protein KQI86_04335 [Clostridium sp. MSJ-11]|uniref:Uncharacterized protein n=1 Tax=Clostridium mobile TaxID=2841512 RepID=A0ABS6EEV6_9CLOT|nr:hypothetical protein [Clostridium mobile]MBU5483545.1 hypothetical protein [Clostridium mobile]